MMRLLAVFVSSALLVSSQGGAWTQAPSMREARASLAAVSDGKAIYVIGGATSSGTADIDRFDGTSWKRETSLEESLNACAAALVGNDIIVIGGFLATGNHPTDRVRIYNLGTKQWRNGASMPTPRGGIQAAVLDGKVYVIGGGNDMSTLAANEVYDPASDSWTALAPLPTSRGNPALVAIDNRIYAIGGGAGGHPFSDVDIYDPGSNRWTAGPALSTPRVAARAVSYRGTVFVFGGELSSGQALNDTWRLRADRTGWESAPAAPSGKSYAGSAIFNDAVYIIGGSDHAPTFHTTTGTASVERFFVR